MLKLLNANFYRLKKNKMFWLMFIFTTIWAIFTLTTKYQSIKKYHASIEIETLVFNFIYIFSFVIAIFASVFLGDNADYTTRSRIIIGHQKSHIYLANFLTILIVVLTLFFFYTFLILVIGIPLIGHITIPLLEFILKYLNFILILLAYTSILTFLATIISDKVIVTVLSIIIYIFLIFTSQLLVSRLSEPEYFTEAVFTVETGTYSSIEEKNPLYISEKTKKIFRLIIPLNPLGTSLLITNNEEPNLKILPLYSLGITILFINGTLFLFSKKELK